MFPEGVVDPAMDALASCVADNPGEQNLRRNLHKYIHKQGKTLPVEISCAPCFVRKAVGKISFVQVAWPVIMLSTWLRYMLVKASKLILAGHHITDPMKWKKTFKKFWRNYRYIDPSHPIFGEDNPHAYEMFIPYTVHGDEGRGRNKVPVMVESFCPIISNRGQKVTNLKGNLACYTSICLHMYLTNFVAYGFYAYI